MCTQPLTAFAPQGRAREVACDYLVAADGARSALRRALGVPLDGQPALQVGFRAACLSLRRCIPVNGSGQTSSPSVCSSSLQYAYGWQRVAQDISACTRPIM